MPTQDRLLLKKTVLEMVGGIHASTLGYWIKRNGFPEPIWLNPRGTRIAWRESEVIQWLESRPRGVGVVMSTAWEARRAQIAQRRGTPKFGFRRGGQ
jgi:predicted DNA-binding transcriptional regulator AlpA